VLAAAFIGLVTEPAQVQRFESASPVETERIAAEFAAGLEPGDVVLLRGDLGSGKTTFVRGAARALGVERNVTSPTFAIGNVYDGAAGEIAHVDLYRLDELDVGDAAVLEDFLTDRRVAFVEWPHAELAGVAGLRAAVTLAHGGGDQRSIEIEWTE